MALVVLRRWLAPGCAALFLLLGLLVGVAPAAAQPPQALPGLPAWTWQNPRPTGYKLNDVHVFDDQNAFVVGDRGTALRTRDQGRTWQPVNLGTTNELRAVAFATPLVGWAAYNTPAPPPNPNWPSSSIGRGEVKKTTDGGLTWATQLTGGEPDGIGMRTLKFFSPTVGYVLYNLYQPGANGVLRICWTADGGQTWTGRFLDPSVKAAQFTTPLVGYNVGNGGVYKTTDGGLTYANVTPDPVAYPNILYETLFFVDTQNGFVAGGPDGTAPNFFRTTNGGQTWTPVNGLLTPNPYYLDWRSLSFADPLRGLATASLGSYLTLDGGQTWAPAGGTVPYGASRHLRPSGVGFSTGELGSLIVTNDFGRTRLRGDSLFISSIAKLAFPDPVRGWAVNQNGELARTDDRGVNWQRLDRLVTAPGINWTPQSTRYTYAGAFPDADTAYVAGVENVGTFPANVDTHFVLKTVDRGQGWVRLPFASPTRTNDIEFRDGRRGLLVGDGGRCWATADGGLTWQPGRRGTTKHLQKVVWADARTAYAIGDSLAFVRTTDAGLT